ncbi:hypothetical protein IAU60_004068 [Kwoniella sp. DSM 27419]
MTLLTHRYRVTLAAVLLVLVASFYLLQGSLLDTAVYPAAEGSSELSEHVLSTADISHGKAEPAGENIPVSGIEAYALSHLQDLQIGYDPQHDLDEYGLKLGNISLADYTAELLSTYERYLTPLATSSPSPPYLDLVLSRLSLRPPSTSYPSRPDQVLTTDKNPANLPWQFKRWEEIMPTWAIRRFDDSQLKGWVRDTFGGSEAQTIWEGLPRPVLKTDIFRYMAMLVEGGIYTDSPEDPPNIYNGPIIDDGAELGLPALIVSVESDAIDFGWTNWRELGLSRAVQITQWTFMARPGHPVFLDALGRTLRISEEMSLKEQEAKDQGEDFMPVNALEWTGPGVFSDCVYRYLLARYGFKPQDLIHKKDPIRVGDVLILPAGSYSSVSPFDEEKTQRPWAASFHGFLGRWREADPAVQEFERLKKEKAKAEEVAKTAAVKAEEVERAVASAVGEIAQSPPPVSIKLDSEATKAEKAVPPQDTDGDGILIGVIGAVPLSPIGR